jgi:hypothetical protein
MGVAHHKQHSTEYKSLQTFQKKLLKIQSTVYSCFTSKSMQMGTRKTAGIFNVCLTVVISVTCLSEALNALWLNQPLTEMSTTNIPRL